MYRNSITLVGYLARDPETRSARDGVPYSVIEVATKESWKNPQGEWQSRTELHRCIAWGPQLSGFVSKLARGNHVQVEVHSGPANLIVMESGTRSQRSASTPS